MKSLPVAKKNLELLKAVPVAKAKVHAVIVVKIPIPAVAFLETNIAETLKSGKAAGLSSLLIAAI